MAELPKRTLGRTGLEVTILGYGALEVAGESWGRDVTPQQAEAVLNAMLDGGINFIDTSIDYGLSEEYIGRFISHRRSEYYLATKCGCQVGDTLGRPRAGRPHVYTRENILAGVNQSLARMKTDYLDVLQFHGNPPRETLEEQGAIQALLDMKREGKARFVGISSLTRPNLDWGIGLGVFDVFQIPYSVFNREHEEIISRAARAGAGVIIRGGAGGRSGPPPAEVWDLWERARLDELRGDMTRMQFILRFTFSHPDLHTNIVGTNKLDHLKDNLNTVRMGPLPPDLLAEAKRRLEAVGIVSQGP